MTAPAIPRLALPFDLDLVLPGSKSVAHRVLVAAALAEGPTRIANATPGDDVRRTFEGLRALGFDLRLLDETAGEVAVAGGPPAAREGGRIDCGNSGTSLRLLISVAALVDGRWELDGDDDLRRRPVGDLVRAWRDLGLEIEDTDGRPPIRLRGGGVRGGAITLRAAASGQFLSSLLLAGASLPEGLEIELEGPLASPGYVALTLETLDRFDVPAAVEGAKYRVPPARRPGGGNVLVESDWSAAGVWSVLSEITGGRYRDPGLRADSRQSDRSLEEVLLALRGDGERVIDLSRMPDQLMNLAVLAARRRGRTRFVGIANLRHKECDRLAVTVRELGRCGFRAEEEAEGIAVSGGDAPRPAVVDPERDHRVAMAFAMLGALGCDVRVADQACVAKSYPDFFADLERAAASPRCLALIGMRGAGKSSIGASLARALDLAFLDVDRVFEAEVAPIAAFVAARGWPAFRAEEAELTESLLRPGRVVSLGGGAVETPAVREALAERALVLWVDEDLATLRERIAADASRPSVTGADPVEEAAQLAERRRPLYESLAAIRLPPGEEASARLERALKEVRATCTW
ncbi:MAG: 3-phosphoshikimate 1-carboxyvinyltransferase [Planctomycetota bacterium]